jgi:menaquinone-dependent protoporphyrinogen IX oxidase
MTNHDKQQVRKDLPIGENKKPESISDEEEFEQFKQRYEQHLQQKQQASFGLKPEGTIQEDWELYKQRKTRELEEANRTEPHRVFGD